MGKGRKGHFGAHPEKDTEFIFTDCPDVLGGGGVVSETPDTPDGAVAKKKNVQ